MKPLLILLLISGASFGAYFDYHHYDVETLKLYEIVGHTDNTSTNIAVNFLDYDTGLTRKDLNKIKFSNEYWFKRKKDVESLTDQDVKAKENEKLLAELMKDPTIKWIFKGNFENTSSMATYKILSHDILLLSRFFRLFAINPNSIKIISMTKNY